MISTTGASLPYDLYIAPNSNGHFSNYFEVLSRSQCDVQSVFLEVPGGNRGLRAILERVALAGSRPRMIHLLFGENYLTLALRLRARGFCVSGIFYYVQHRSRRDLRSRLSRIALLIANTVGVRLISLEPPTVMKPSVFTLQLYDIFDLESHSARAPQVDIFSSAKRILVAGHITPRKIVTDIIDAAAKIAREDGQTIELRLVGSIEPSYRSTIGAAIAAAKCDQLTVVVTDDRVSSSYLRSELEQADVISALYLDHYGSSGMVVNAMALGRPVVFFPIGALRGFAEQLPNARQPHVREDIADSIRAALAEPSLFMLNATDRAKFIAMRRPERFAESFHAMHRQGR